MNYSQIMDDLLRGEVERGYVRGASALVLKDGKEVYSGACGYADYEKKQPMKRDTIIRLYSMSKPITATAVMMLQERGLIDLLDPISKYLPEFGEMEILREVGGIPVPARNQITITHLLNMTSGIPYREFWEGSSAAGLAMDAYVREVLEADAKGPVTTTREFVRGLAACPLAFEPGERWMYGYSADILGAIVEIVSGMSFGEFLRRNIFNPLQMPDTGFYVPDSKKDRFAMSYDWSWEKSELVPSTESYLCEHHESDVCFESGGAGLVSTLDDYGHFASMLANDGVWNGRRILASTTVSFMRQNRLTPEQSGALDWDSNRGYGYGCLMRQLIDQTKAGTCAPIGEFGWDGWTGNYFTMDPANNLVIIYFIQRRGSDDASVIRKIRAVTFAEVDRM